MQKSTVCSSQAETHERRILPEGLCVLLADALGLGENWQADSQCVCYASHLGWLSTDMPLVFSGLRLVVLHAMRPVFTLDTWHLAVIQHTALPHHRASIRWAGSMTHHS